MYLALKRIAHEVDTPQTSILIARIERLEAVAQVCQKGGNRSYRKERNQWKMKLTVLSAGACQVGCVVGTTTLGAIPSTNQSVGHHQWDIILVGPAAAFNSDSHMGQGQRVITYAHLRASETAGRHFWWQNTSLQLAQTLFGQLDQLIVLHTTGTSQNNATCLVVSLNVVG